MASSHRPHHHISYSATLSLDGKVYAHKAFSNAHTQYHRGRYGTTLLTPNIAVVVAGAVKGILKVRDVLTTSDHACACARNMQQ